MSQAELAELSISLDECEAINEELKSKIRTLEAKVTELENILQAVASCARGY